MHERPSLSAMPGRRQGHSKAILLLGRAAEVLYDMFCFSISTVDMIVDIALAATWYRRQMHTFFWLAVINFLIAQMAYTFYFVTRFAGTRSSFFCLACFAVVFPFAQLVPLIIWIQSYNIPWVDKQLAVFGLVGWSVESHESEDWLQDWIAKKKSAHFGFIIESFAESVPQSILQIVALMVYSHQISSLEMLSLLLSIANIGSRCVLFAYSVSRPTFIFNFLCFLADVFGIFACVSWVFLNPLAKIAALPPSAGPSDTWPFESRFLSLSFMHSLHITNVWSAAWVYLMLLTALCWALLMIWRWGCFTWRVMKGEERASPVGWLATGAGIAAPVGSGMRTANSDRDRVALLSKMVGMLFFGAVVFLPCFTALHAFTLSVFPVMIFGALGEAHLSPGVMQRLYSFLKDSKNDTDFARRSTMISRFYAHALAGGIQPLSSDPTYHEGVLLATRNPDDPITKEALRVIKRVREKIKPSELTLCGSIMNAFRLSLINYRAKLHRTRYPEKIGVGFMGVVAFPITVISSLYSLAFPLISMCREELSPANTSMQWTWTPSKSLSIELVLTVFYLICLVLMIFFIPSVLRFYRVMRGVRRFGLIPRHSHVKEIGESYWDAETRRIHESVTMMSVLVASLRSTRTVDYATNRQIQDHLKQLRQFRLHEHHQLQKQLLSNQQQSQPSSPEEEEVEEDEGDEGEEQDHVQVQLGQQLQLQLQRQREQQLEELNLQEQRIRQLQEQQLLEIQQLEQRQQQKQQNQLLLPPTNENSSQRGESVVDDGDGGNVGSGDRGGKEKEKEKESGCHTTSSSCEDKSCHGECCKFGNNDDDEKKKKGGLQGLFGVGKPFCNEDVRNGNYGGVNDMDENIGDQDDQRGDEEIYGSAEGNNNGNNGVDGQGIYRPVDDGNDAIDQGERSSSSGGADGGDDGVREVGRRRNNGDNKLQESSRYLNRSGENSQRLEPSESSQHQVDRSPEGSIDPTTFRHFGSHPRYPTFVNSASTTQTTDRHCSDCNNIVNNNNSTNNTNSHYHQNKNAKLTSSLSFPSASLPSSPSSTSPLTRRSRKAASDMSEHIISLMPEISRFIGSQSKENISNMGILMQHRVIKRLCSEAPVFFVDNDVLIDPFSPHPTPQSIPPSSLHSTPHSVKSPLRQTDSATRVRARVLPIL